MRVDFEKLIHAILKFDFQFFTAFGGVTYQLFQLACRSGKRPVQAFFILFKDCLPTQNTFFDRIQPKMQPLCQDFSIPQLVVWHMNYYVIFLANTIKAANSLFN